MAKASDNVFPKLILSSGAAPATPPAGQGKIYEKSSDKKVYFKNEDGTEYDLTATGSVTFIGARAYNSANISCANGTDTALTFNSERYDTDTIHSTSSNTGRLTATTAGKYHISGTATFAANGTGARGLQIRLNGTTTLALVRLPAVTGGTDVTALTIDTDWDMSATDYVELLAYQTSGGALNVVNGGNYSPEFMMHKVG